MFVYLSLIFSYMSFTTFSPKVSPCSQASSAKENCRIVLRWWNFRFPCCVLLALSWNTTQQKKFQVQISWVGQSTSEFLTQEAAARLLFNSFIKHPEYPDLNYTDWKTKWTLPLIMKKMPTPMPMLRSKRRTRIAMSRCFFWEEIWHFFRIFCLVTAHLGHSSLTIGQAQTRTKVIDFLFWVIVIVLIALERNIIFFIVHGADA